MHAALAGLATIQGGLRCRYAAVQSRPYAMSKVLVPSAGPGDWQRLLAKLERQGMCGCSACIPVHWWEVALS